MKVDIPDELLSAAVRKTLGQDRYDNPLLAAVSDALRGKLPEIEAAVSACIDEALASFRARLPEIVAAALAAGASAEAEKLGRRRTRAAIEHSMFKEREA